MVLEAACLGLGLVLILLFYLLGKLSEKVHTLYLKLKQLMIWNAFIRYIFHSSLKLQITAATVISIALSAKSP